MRTCAQCLKVKGEKEFTVDNTKNDTCQKCLPLEKAIRNLQKRRKQMTHHDFVEDLDFLLANVGRHSGYRYTGEVV